MAVTVIFPALLVLSPNPPGAASAQELKGDAKSVLENLRAATTSAKEPDAKAKGMRVFPP